MRPKKGVTLRDIAEELGISAVTVSNALAGKKGVSEEKREQILECALRRGLDLAKYRQRTTPNKEASEEGASIGVMVLNRYISVGTSFYWEMYQKTAYVASGLKCLTSLIIWKSDSEESAIPPQIANQEIDGLILIGPMDDGYKRRLKKAFDGPIVLLDQPIFDDDVSCVLSGDYYGMYRSARELIRAGHREIGFVGSLDYSKNIIDRYYGYKKCMRENGLSVRKEWVLPDRYGKEERGLVVLPDTLPTAFVTSSDWAASYLYDALQERGLSVPEDISIASYDDYLYNHPLAGRLTTYHVDMEHMARCAVRLVIRGLIGPGSTGVICEVDSHMVLRDSIRKI